MIEQLHSLNCHNIIIVDNASTYPPLLDYLKSVENKLTVLKLPENKGPHFIVTNFYYYFLPIFVSLIQIWNLIQICQVILLNI